MMRSRNTQGKYHSAGCRHTPTRALLVLLIMLIGPGGAAHAISIARVNNDKSRYDPAEQVVFNLALQGTVTGSQEVRVTYRHLSEVVETQTVPVTSSSLAWAWTPPTTDYRGYTVEMEVIENSVVTGRSSIAVDVSSDWARFPRYGFLSAFPNLTSAGMDAVIDKLNRYHINGLQFYDWSDKHHKPLAGTGANPDATWQDIANRTNTFSAVSGYIQRAHDRNMVAMSYNLIYATLDDAASDGVQASWTLHTNPSATNPDVHDMPDGWKSDLFLVDPSNTGWQQYIADKTAEAFVALPFDGWHIDQLGNRGTRYDSNGTPVNLAATFGPFVDTMSAWLNKRMVFNAVNQYGQSGVADADVDFLYTEVWDPFNHYNDLANIILANNAHGNGQLNTVLAAYVNYNLTDSPDTFNAPSVLLTDAVIFAFGGAHLELGEHMLRHEYFPIDNLLMTADLREQLTGYYDFLVGYQNLLRDGGTFGSNPMSSSNAGISMWPAQQGDISIINKTVDGREVFHLINFTDAVHMDWRDGDGVQPEPSQVTGIDLSFVSASQIAKLWAASPDDGGLPFELSFTQDGLGLVSFTLPSLKYWSMIVAEPFISITGDVNGDGFVGIEDLNIILSNWNQTVPIGDHSRGDLAGIGDGFVGIEDLNVVLGNWNAGTPPAGDASANIPEPASLVCLGLVSLGLLTRVR